MRNLQEKGPYWDLPTENGTNEEYWCPNKYVSLTGVFDLKPVPIELDPAKASLTMLLLSWFADGFCPIPHSPTN